jgi:ubiquinone/menaquinone biosynthesis C-methylase UbiE
MKLVFFCFILPLLIFDNSSAQNAQSKKTQIEQKRQMIKNGLMNFYNFSSTDVIADIGSGNGGNIILIASFYPKVKFTIEDIDKETCNAQNFKKEIDKSGHKVNVENFKFCYGTEKSTMLPSKTYTKVLINDLIHELTYSTEMIADLKRILKNDGRLLVSEIVVVKKATKEKGCNYPYMTELELKNTLVNNKFIVAEEKKFMQISDNKYILLLTCIPIQ